MKSIPHSVKQLSRWFEKSHRALPWRATRDPYCIWISEVMLQQTQVATVLPYYERFLKEFPTVRSLADAPTERVLELWSGLGYYSRARNLQNGARHLLSLHQGTFPKTRDALLGVPGIGPYTAGAVLSIAFDLPEAIVDGNVQRVITRYYRWTEILESRATQDWLWEKAREWVEHSESPRILNQALMELGATICRKDSPACEQCPLSKGCEAYRLGSQAELPVRRPRKKAVDLWWSAPVIVNEDSVWLTVSPSGQWWEGLWTVPFVPLEDSERAETEIRRWSKQQKLTRPEFTHLGEVRHTVTHHKLHVLPSIVCTRSPLPTENGKWFALESVDEQALSSLTRKILRSAQSHLQ